MIWQRYPSVRVLLCFIASIIVYPYFHFSVYFPSLFFGITFSISMAFQIFPRLKKNANPILIGLIFKLSLFSAMWLLQSLEDPKNHPLHYSKQSYHEGYHQFSIQSEIQEGEKVFKAEAELISLKSEQTSSLNGKVLLYFKKDSIRPLPKYGDQIIWKGKLSEIAKPTNPEEFDFKKYLEASEIYAQAFLDGDSWTILKVSESQTLRSISIEFREDLLEEIDSWEAPKEVLGISKALLLGYKNDLEENLRNSYSNTGVAHILAVSGLHVGMLYVLLSLLLVFLKKAKGGELIRSIILLLALWFYAFLTGLSPSVLRSVCMFSCIAFGGFFSREVSVYNTLSASAILLLLIDPKLLFNLGFQLSYSAVFFIVWMQKYLKTLWIPKTWLGKQIWSICSVSIAAQLGTSILSIYYFHQFPSYFLLSNLVVIPLISLIMYCGLAVLILKIIGLSAIFLLRFYTWLVKTMNSSIRFLEKIPGSRIDSLHLSFYDLLLAYSILILVLCWLFYGKRWRLQLSLVLALAFLILQWKEKYEINSTERFIFFSVNRHTVLGFQSASSMCLIADEGFFEDEKQFQYKVEPFIISRNIIELKKENYKKDFQNPRLIKSSDFLKTKFGLFWQVSQIEKSPPSDYWIVNSAVEPILKLENKPKMVFLNTQLPKKISGYWKEWSLENGVPLWDLKENGFYESPNLLMAYFSFL